MSSQLTNKTGHVLSTVLLLVTVIFIPSCMTRLGPHHPGGPVRKVHSSGSGHHHHVPTKSEDGHTQKLTSDVRLLHDKEHMREDLGDWVFEDGKEMSPEEMEFHYFRMHDFDNNTALDGLEILQALIHVLPIDDVEEDDSQDPQGQNTQKYSVNYESIRKPMLREDDFNYYIDLIDKVFEQDDLNHDGLLSYPEYVIGRRKLNGKETARSPIF